MPKDKQLVLIIHNVRSAHNVGSLFRTANGAGVDEIILTGYTPTPTRKKTLHCTSAEKAFHKTALGAELGMVWKKSTRLGKIIIELKRRGFTIVALEQGEKSIRYFSYHPEENVALIVGNEVRGVDTKILKRCDDILEIPMYGQKNSLNVSVAAGIALYHIASRMKDR